MMRINHKTKSCECIIIYHDELYIALTALEEIIHIVKDKYKFKINPHVYQGSNFPYDPGGTFKMMLKNSSSLLLLISCLQRSQNYLGSCVTFLKTICLHVSFTAYENFYKLSKNALSSQMLSTFSPSEVSEITNATIKHISTNTLVHSSIITYMGDHFLVIFCP